MNGCKCEKCNPPGFLDTRDMTVECLCGEIVSEHCLRHLRPICDPLDLAGLDEEQAS